MKILVINGPNINLLGRREVEIYGKKDYTDLCNTIKEFCKKNGIEVAIKQSNHEGYIVDFIQEALKENVDGIVINAAAYSHTSIAIHDAIKAVMIPTIAVHLTNIYERETFRQKDIVGLSCANVCMGKGFESYLEAIALLQVMNSKI